MIQLRKLALALTLASTLAGCASTPFYLRPPAPVPVHFPERSADDGKAATELPWREFFADETLRSLIEAALANNRDLRIALLNIEQARAQLGLREADRLPTVGAGISASTAPQANGTNARSITAGLQFTAWELDFFGRLSALSEVARAQWLATDEARKATQITLVAAVATAWLNLAADEELLALTAQTLETREESLRLTRLRFDNGAASELDFRQAQSLAESAKVVLAQLQRQRALDRNALVLLVGGGIATAPAQPPRLADITLADVPAGLPSDVLVQRPDIKQAELLLIAANANIGAARAAFLPRISLTGGFGSVSRDLSGLFAGGSWGFTVAPQLLAPIFDAGRNEAALRSASVSRDIALTQYERAIQSAFREVADALAGRSTFIDQLRAQAQVAEAEAARLHLATLRYENGIASYLDLLDAQRSLFSARQAVIQTRLQQLQNQVLLYRSLGGGWSPAERPAS